MGYYRLARRVKNVDLDKKSNKNKVFEMFFRKVKEHTENTEIKINIDIFYELCKFNLSLTLAEEIQFYCDLPESLY